MLLKENVLEIKLVNSNESAAVSDAPIVFVHSSSSEAMHSVSFSFSKWTGKNELNLGKNVIICNIGILQSNKSNISWLSDVDVCIVDEVHKLRRGNKINKILKQITTPHHFGFTGTMPEDSVDQWNVIGKNII